MGACASVPKGMRGEATAAPARKPPKEDVQPIKANEATTTTTGVIEKNPDDVKDKKEEDSDKNGQSIGKLLEEGEASTVSKEEASSSCEGNKVESSESKAEQLLVSKPAIPVKPKGEETTPVTPLTISEPPAPVTPKVEETSTVRPPQAEAAAKDEMKTELMEQK